MRTKVSTQNENWLSRTKSGCLVNYIFQAFSIWTSWSTGGTERGRAQFSANSDGNHNGDIEFPKWCINVNVTPKSHTVKNFINFTKRQTTKKKDGKTIMLYARLKRYTLNAYFAHLKLTNGRKGGITNIWNKLTGLIPAKTPGRGTPSKIKTEENTHFQLGSEHFREQIWLPNKGLNFALRGPIFSNADIKTNIE